MLTCIGRFTSQGVSEHEMISKMSSIACVIGRLRSVRSLVLLRRSLLELDLRLTIEMAGFT